MKRIHNLFLLAVLTVVASITAAANPVLVSNVEELYAAVNDPANSGSQIVLAPGTYILSRNDPSGVERPNRGRLELKENMSLIGMIGDRSSVIIDAGSLPQASFQGSIPTMTGAIRIGRGWNSIEWLTVRNARVASSAIEADLISTVTAHVRVAHIASTGNIRGFDARNFGTGTSGRTFEVDIIDNDFFENTFGLAEGFRVGNFAGTTGSTVNVRMIGNRSYGNEQGRLIVNNQAFNSTINAVSTGNRFYGNGAGTNVIGGLGGATSANGNTINMEIHGDRYFENALAAQFDRGGLVIVGGENTVAPNRVNNNTVNVRMWGTRFYDNFLADLYVVGARSLPAKAGIPGSGNMVTVEINGLGNAQFIQFLADGLPNDAGETNSATITR
ncbi:MAG: hypothetical protein PSX80_00595 [bacterium]|nr:hypothetical protein [bacterium]